MNKPKTPPTKSPERYAVSTGDRPKVAGVVLSGGLSRRMGVRKADMRLPDGRTMLEAALDGLRSSVVEVTILGHRSDRIPGVPFIEDSGGRGPLWGVLQALEAHVAETLLIVPCDMPLLSPELLTMLIGADRCACFRDDSGILPLPLRVDLSSLLHMRDLVQNRHGRSLHDFLEEANPIAIDVARDRRHELANVNTPEDFADLCALMVRR